MLTILRNIFYAAPYILGGIAVSLSAVTIKNSLKAWRYRRRLRKLNRELSRAAR